MSSFGEQEEKEEIAWQKFKEWLDHGGWKYKRFRYSKKLSKIDFRDLGLTERQNIELKKAIGEIDFDHDGIMSRGPETWLFDLKYKTDFVYRTWVNQNSYDAYWTLKKECGVNFLIVAYVHNEDELYFHGVRDPSEDPIPKRQWSYKDKKWVYIMPEREYLLITGFNAPFEFNHPSEIGYHVVARLTSIKYLKEILGLPIKEKTMEEVRREVIEDMETDYPKPWQILREHLKIENPLKKVAEPKEELKKKKKAKTS